MKKTCLILGLLLAGLSVAPSKAVVFSATLSGAAEETLNSPPGVGFALVVWDQVALTMTIDASFSGLEGNTTAAHIHAPTTSPNVGGAGVATQVPYFAGFPIGVQSGTYRETFDLQAAGTYHPSFLTAAGGTPEGAAAVLLQALLDEKAYFNIHSSVYGGGEIRGFLRQVPDGGATAVMLGVGFLMLAGWRRLAVGR